MIHEAVILAGGLGTRLKESVPDLPKPMAPIGGRPFLAYVIDYLHQSGIDKVIISVGHLSKPIIDYFGHQYKNIQIDYAVESEPLGTGGGIMLALDQIKGPELAIINGDTFFPVPLREMYDFYRFLKADVTIALKPMHNFDRYGGVVLENNKVIRFDEKKFTEFGLINGGIYIVRRNIFIGAELTNKFSFERDFLENKINRLFIAGFSCDQYFIDIGIPEDYARAVNELPHWILYGQ